MKSMLAWIGACLAAASGTAKAGIVCPDSSYCTVSFATTKDRITIVPNGSGDTFAAAGITIRVYIKDCFGVPIPGVPAESIVIYNSALCICPGGNTADGPTDENGCTSFSGTLRGGGCAENLTIFWDGVAIATLPVKTNSTDAPPASPCGVDASDMSAVAAVLGRPDRYTPCLDWNESGPPTIDASELSFFAQTLGARCE